jgi:hypothetical protein
MGIRVSGSRRTRGPGRNENAVIVGPWPACAAPMSRSCLGDIVLVNPLMSSYLRSCEALVPTLTHPSSLIWRDCPRIEGGPPSINFCLAFSVNRALFLCPQSYLYVAVVLHLHLGRTPAAISLDNKRKVVYLLRRPNLFPSFLASGICLSIC